VGPFVPHPRVAGSIRARLFLFLDDYSRLILHGVWVTHENARAGQHVLRAAIARRGIPEVVYLDYADLRVMPTSAETSCSGAVSGLKLSA
ncbi:MAG: hypothetical protein QOH66_2259, partial [Actinomycetota bacterium]|nr:hypothetical protein [Actinomycetota bacterium]